MNTNKKDNMTDKQIVHQLRAMAKDDKTPSELLRYLVLDQKIEQQLELMKLFSESFNVTLGEVTAITAWWHDDTAEMNDNDINAYLSSIIKVN